MLSFHLRKALPVLCFLTGLAAQDVARLSVTVVDPSDAVVPAAKLTLLDTRRGTAWQAETSINGYAVLNSLPPSEYSLEVVKTGFDKVQIQKLVLSIRDSHSVRIQLKVASQTPTSVTVTALSGLNNSSTLGVDLDQDYVTQLPVNGRNVENLILMAPGVTTPAGGRGAGINANGLRSNTNYYTLDGLSLNTAISGGPGAGGGAFRGGGASGAGGFGGSNAAGYSSGVGSELISIDAMAELRVQTSPIAPEFGRTPGAQVAITSRSGSNDIHGSLFYYFRNDQLAANDWFANAAGLPRGKLRQDRPGGTIGGSLKKDKTFYFASVEALRLSVPATLVATVPDMATRSTARVNLQPFLRIFPIPNGPSLGAGAGLFNAQIINPVKTQSASLRLDHALTDKSNIFVRYSFTPSSNTVRGGELLSPSVLTARKSRSHVVTAGWLKSFSPTRLNDLRVNYSRANNAASATVDAFGGAAILDPALVFPRGVNPAEAEFTLNILGLSSYSLGNRSDNTQKQYNIVNTHSIHDGPHSFKVGVDFRRISLVNARIPYSHSLVFNGLAGDSGSFLSGIATNAQVSASLPSVYPIYTNFSVYAQDTLRSTDRLTLTYGVRYDVNPAPGVARGPRPFAQAETALAGVTQNDPIYETRWFNIAPRFGLAYQMDTTPGRELMLRMGVGLFYDLGYGISAAGFNGAPYSSVRTISAATIPLGVNDLAAPALPPVRPFGQVTTAEFNLKSPTVIQWNASVDRYYGAGNTMLSIGIVGTRGRNLLRVETQPVFSNAVEVLRISTNGATSDYYGLQAQFRRRLSSNLQTQASYTYGHSVDTASNDAGLGGAGGFATLLGSERGSSDFDIRHNVNWSGSYLLPLPQKGALGAVLGNWYTDWVATFRTGLPFDVTGISSSTSDSAATGVANFRRGLFAQIRPNYNGQPIYVVDANAPGGKRLNRAAFVLPTGFGQGNLGRNSIRGFSAGQVDFALRRQFNVSEKWRLHFAAQAYNALNTPNFANPSPLEGASLTSPNFGIVNRMLNQTFGGATNSVFRSGGPRSVEFSVRLQF